MKRSSCCSGREWNSRNMFETQPSWYSAYLLGNCAWIVFIFCHLCTRFVTIRVLLANDCLSWFLLMYLLQFGWTFFYKVQSYCEMLDYLRIVVFTESAEILFHYFENIVEFYEQSHSWRNAGRSIYVLEGFIKSCWEHIFSEELTHFKKVFWTTRKC